MTEEEYKCMLKDILCNNAEYERRLFGCSWWEDVNPITQCYKEFAYYRKKMSKGNKMTEIENKAEEYARTRNCETCNHAHLPPIYCLDNGNHCILCGHDKESYIKGYEQGQKDFQCSLVWRNNELHEENEELKAQIDKMKPYLDCCGCRFCDEELTIPELNKTICEVCENHNKWEIEE